MSVDNIYNDLYPFLIKDWKNTSLVVTKDTSQKSFSMILKKFIEYSYERSKYAVDLEAIIYYQDNLLDNSLHQDFKKVFDNVTLRYEDLLNIDIKSFSIQIINELSKNNSFITSLRPQGWEQFILANRNKIVDLTEYNDNWSSKRSDVFKGFDFPDDDFGFYDKISLFVTAKKFLERDIPPYLTLFKSIAQYVFNYNKKLNTNDFIRNVDEILDSGTTNKNLKHYFKSYYSDDDIKLDFELIEEKEKKKEDLNNMLKKLSKVK